MLTNEKNVVIYITFSHKYRRKIQQLYSRRLNQYREAERHHQKPYQKDVKINESYYFNGTTNATQLTA